MFERFVKSYAGRRYRHTAIVQHKGTVVAFAMDDTRRLFYAVLDLAGAPGTPSEKSAPASLIDIDAWPAIPAELAFSNEIADVGFGVVDQRTLRVFREGATQPEPPRTSLPARGTADGPFRPDYFLSTTARLTADAPFQVISDNRFVYVFRQAIRANEPGMVVSGELRANPVAGGGTPLVDGHLLVDRFLLLGATLVQKPEVRFQRSRSKTRPQSAKDSLGPRDLDGNDFFEPTQALRFLGPVEPGRFAVTMLPTQVAEVERWQIFTHNRDSGQIDSFNIERAPDGLFNTRGSEIYTCPDHPRVFQARPGKCTEPRTGDETTSCGKDLIPRRVLFGHAESALAFGAGTQVLLPREPVVTSPLTLEAWIKPARANAPMALFTRKTAQGTLDPWLLLASRDGSDRLDLVIGGLNTAGSAAVTLPGCVPVDAWSHLALTFAAQSCRVYLDGALVRRIDAAPGQSPMLRLAAIGHAAQSFQGIIDEVRLWNRTRFARELAAGRNERLTGLEPGLAGYWRFDEGSGGYAHDQTASAAHGTIVGATWVASDAPIGEHPGIERSSLYFAGRTIAAAPSALLYYQQAEVSGGYSGTPKPVKQGARLMLVVPTTAGDSAMIAALDFGVSGTGRITQAPDRIELSSIGMGDWNASEGVSRRMPHLHTDRFGLRLSGGLLPFATTLDAPALFASASGQIAMYFRETPAFGAPPADATRHCVAHYSTRTVRARYVLIDAARRPALVCAARSVHVGSDRIRITVGPGSTPHLCDVAMEGDGFREAWRDVPRTVARFAQVINGEAIGRGLAYDYRSLASTSKVGADPYDGSLLARAWVAGEGTSVADQTLESAEVVVSTWTSAPSGYAIGLHSNPAAPGSYATLAEDAPNPSFSGDVSAELWANPQRPYTNQRLLTHRSDDGATQIALGLRTELQDSAVSLQSISDFVTLGQGIPLDAHRMASFTIEAWVRIDNAVGTRSIIGATADAGALLSIWVGANHRLHFGCDGRSQTVANDLGDTWWHVALVYDGSAASGQFTFHLDAKPVATLHMPAGISDTARAIGILGLPQPDANGAVRALTLDELRVWRRARTVEAIRADRSRHLTGNEPDLEACFRFDGGVARDHTVAAHGALLISGKAAPSAVSNFRLYAAANGKAVQTRSSWARDGWIHVAATFDQSWALEFDRSGMSWLDCGDGGSLDIPGDLTIEMTVRLDRLDGGHGLISRGRVDGTDDTQNVPYAFYVAPTGKLRFAFQDGKHRTQFTGAVTPLIPHFASGAFSGVTEPIGPWYDENGKLLESAITRNWIESNTALAPGRAYRIAVRRRRIRRNRETGKDAEQRQKSWEFDAITFFVDGAFDGAVCYVGDQGVPDESGQPAEVGSHNGVLEVGRGFTAQGRLRIDAGEVAAPAIQALAGLVAEVRVWGLARPDAAIGAPIHGHEKGLIGWWRFDEGSGSRVTDAKGSSHARIRGMLPWRRDPDINGSALHIYCNGRREATEPAAFGFDAIGIIDDAPQFTIGGRTGAGVDGRPGLHDYYAGQLDEIRLWRSVRTEEQIGDNLFARLTGTEDGLEAYYWSDKADKQNGAPARLSDRSGHRHDLSLRQALAHPTDAPIGFDLPQIRDAFARDARNRRVDYEWTIASRPATQEYADTQYDSQGNLIGVLKRCHAVIRDGRWTLVTGYKVGDLITEWLGQAQFAPELKGYIEGAPPVPSENLTQRAVPGIGDLDDYNQASTIALVQSEELTRTYSASRDGGFDMAIEASQKGGYEVEAEAGTPFFSTTVASGEIHLGVKTTWEFSQGWLQEASTSSGYTTGRTTSLELRGRFATIGTRRRFVPDNVGLALVQSETADVYALRLKQNNALVGYRMLPNPDIPKDWNLLTFQINPRYSKQGTLDGKIGLEADASYPNALQYSGDASYFKPVEAYALKDRVRREEATAAAYYEAWDAAARGKRAASYGGPNDLLTGELLDKLPRLHQAPRLHKRNLVNTYVWTADGGFFAETEETMDAQQESTGGNYAFKGMAGLAFDVSGVVPGGIMAGGEIEALFGGHLNLTATKARESSASFQLEVALDTVERDLFERTLDADNNVITLETREPGKVDAYRFMTFYLEPDSASFDAFYNNVVDPLWLASDDPAAAALRQARQDGKKPACWRVLHRVTYVSRVLPRIPVGPAGSLDAVLPTLDIDSNYELVRQLDPYVREHVSTYAELAEDIRSAIVSRLPALEDHLDGIVAWMARYYDIGGGTTIEGSGDAADGPARPPNAPPVARAGDDQSVLTDASGLATVDISGSAADDRIADPEQLEVVWSMVGGPAPVRFHDRTPAGWSLESAATGRTLHARTRFAQRGKYVLRLTADDGALTASDDVTVLVNDRPRARITTADLVPRRAGATWTLDLEGEVDSGLADPPSDATAAAAAVDARFTVAGTASLGSPTWSMTTSADGYSLRVRSTLTVTHPGSYRVALSATDARSTPEVIVTVMPRVTAGLLALWQFTPDGIEFVADRVIRPAPLDLIVNGATFVSRVPAAKWTDAVARSNAFTVEMWIRPQVVSAGGLRRILTVSGGPGARNVIVGQTGDRLHVGVRTAVGAGLDENASTRAFTGGRLVPDTLVHVVCTRASDGMTRLYADGALVASRRIEGVCAQWDRTFKLALGDELNADDGIDRLWHGTFRLAALYDRALDDAEITQNFSVGADPALPVTVMAGGDRIIDWTDPWPAGVTLAGRVQPDRRVEVVWSGPLPASTDPAALRTLQPTIAFPGPAVARLRLTATDGDFIVTDDASIEVCAAPRVNAPSVQRVTLTGALATLVVDATLVDAGRDPASMRYAWRFDGAPDPACQILEADQLRATLRVTGPGDFRLVLVASNGRPALDLTVPVRVLASAPSVIAMAGEQLVNLPDRVVSLGTTLSRDGRADRSVPIGYSWTVLEGPGAVDFAPTADGAGAVVTFGASGEYRVAVVATDAALPDHPARAETTVVINEPPVVDAGPDQRLLIATRGETVIARLDATVTDDGLPRTPGVLHLQWTSTGPHSVPFAGETADYARALFSTNGRYLLGLAASDGAASVTDTLTIDVDAPPEFTVDAPGIVAPGVAARCSVTVTNDGLAIADPAALRYTWAVTPDAGVTVDRPDQATVRVTCATAGEYQVQVTVANGRASATQSVPLSVVAHVGGGLVALFDFRDGSGDRVADRADRAPPVEVRIEPEGAATWLPQDGLRIESAINVFAHESDVGLVRVIGALKASNALTLEAWLRPAATKTGPWTVFSVGYPMRSDLVSIALYQVGRRGGASRYRVRLMLSAFDATETAIELESADGTAGVRLAHVAFTRDAAGQARLYLDGALVETRVMDGTFGPWSDAAALAIGATPGVRTGRWSGELFRIGLYERVLSPAEIGALYAARPMVSD